MVLATAKIPCEQCEQGFTPRSKRSRFCSDKCRYAHRDARRTIPCAACGGPMIRDGKMRPGKSRHRRCLDKPPHGSVSRYQSGCRCDNCRSAKAAANRKHRAEYLAKYGRSLNYNSRKPSRGHRFVDNETRLRIYERDRWICQLCSGPVDPDLHWNDRMAPTLDHIECQSWSPVPDHSESNLRLAHRSCNSARHNRQ